MQHAKTLAKGASALTREDVRRLHEVMLSEAWPSTAGQYRQVEIDAFAPIGDIPPHPSQVEEQMFLFGRELRLRTATPPGDPAAAVAIAIWAHMELVRIHPFQEGNGKTARLLMNVPIMRHVTSPTLPLDIAPAHRDRYMMCVQEHRQGRAGPFEALVADLLEELARREERRAELLPVVRRRVRWPRRRPRA